MVSGKQWKTLLFYFRSQKSCFTCSFSQILLRCLAGQAPSQAVYCHHSEGIVDIGRQLQLGCGLSSRDFSLVMPQPRLMHCIFIFNDKFWPQHTHTTNPRQEFSHPMVGCEDDEQDNLTRAAEHELSHFQEKFTRIF